MIRQRAVSSPEGQPATDGGAATGARQAATAEAAGQRRRRQAGTPAGRCTRERATHPRRLNDKTRSASRTTPSDQAVARPPPGKRGAVPALLGGGRYQGR